MEKLFSVYIDDKLQRNGVARGATVQVGPKSISIPLNASIDAYIAHGFFPESVEDDEYDYDTEHLGDAYWDKQERKSVYRRSPVTLTDDDYANIRERAISSIKKHCEKAILDLYTEWEQRNMTAALLLLSLKTNLSAEESITLTELTAAWRKIQALRERSNSIEADVNSASNNRTEIDQAAKWSTE